MKKTLFALLALPLFTLAAAEYRVTGKIVAPSCEKVSICDGENFHPVKPDGSFSFTQQAGGFAPFVYVDYPSELVPEGAWSAPLKEGENTLKFTLKKRPSVPRTFTFIHGSDVQYDFKKKGKELANDMAELKEIMRAHDAQFIVFPGDLTERGDPEQLTILRREIEKNKMPYFAYFGGHDRYCSKPSLKVFSECIGAPYFAWNFGGVHFISPVSEYMSLPKEEGEWARQEHWIANDLNRLAPGTPVLVNTHQPWNVFPAITKIAAAKKLKLLGFLGGHLHCHNLYTRKGLPVLCVAPLRSHDTGTFTKRARLVTINPDGIVRTETRLLNQKQRIEANVFCRRLLTIRLLDHATDPVSVEAAFAGVPVKLERKSACIWQGTLAQDCPAGKEMLQVKVDCGKQGKWKDRMVFISEAPHVKWVHVLPMIQRQYPRPVICGDKVFLGVDSGELPQKEGGVIALSLADGKELWRWRGADVASGVASDGTTVRALTVDGDIVTLDAANGKLLRKFSLPGDDGYRRTGTRLCFADGKLLAVLINGGAKMYAFDPATDKMLWKKPLELGPAWENTGYAVSNGVIYFTGCDNYGAARLADGTEIWRTREKRLKTTFASPLPDGDAVYFPLRGTLRKVDAKTGKIIWKQGFSGSTCTIGGVVRTGDKLLSVSTNALCTRDAADGKNFKRVNLQPLSRVRGITFQNLASTAAPVLWNNKVLALGDDGGVYYLDPATARPTPVFHTGFAFKGTPAVSGDKVCFVGFDGLVYMMQAK